jgi:hypothetical protein
MPPAFGTDNAGRQLVCIGIIWIRRQDTIDHATSAIAPLAAAALYAGVGESETLFGRSPLMGEFDKKIVHHPAVIQERNDAIRLHHSQKDGAGGASRARAKRLRWAACAVGVRWLHDARG